MHNHTRIYFYINVHIYVYSCTHMHTLSSYTKWIWWWTELDKFRSSSHLSKWLNKDYQLLTPTIAASKISFNNIRYLVDRWAGRRNRQADRETYRHRKKNKGDGERIEYKNVIHEPIDQSIDREIVKQIHTHPHRRAKIDR